MTKKATVSVVCITFNQEKFIAQALESFVAQQATFPFEVIIADDCSTDSTQKIIREFSDKYPGVIKTIFQTKNVGVQRNLKSALLAATGDYIALCEGDDYWTDKEKIQRQADFLDTHGSYSLCFHPVTVHFEGGGEPDSTYPNRTRDFTLARLLEDNFIQTNSVMYRRQSYEGLPIDLLPLDWYLHLYHAQFGRIGFIDQNMAVYRRHPGGIWWDSFKNPSLIWKNYGDKYLMFLHHVMNIYGSNTAYRKIIVNRSIADVYESMAQLPPQFIDDVAIRSIKITPRESWYYMKSLIGQVRYHAGQSDELKFKLNQESTLLRVKQKEVKDLSEELEEITSSNAWKTVSTYRRLKSFIRKTTRH